MWRIGFPVPATAVPRDDSDVAAAAEPRFPVILKPRDAPELRRRFRAQVLEAADAEELRVGGEKAAPYQPQICEVIREDDDRLWTLGSYRDAGGRPPASSTRRKLGQWPPRFATARAAEARWDPNLARRAQALLDELGFHYVLQVGVKRDPRDGRGSLIDVNPRSWSWISMDTVCGVNLPLTCHLDAPGASRHWPESHRGGRRRVLTGKYLVASAPEVRRGEYGACAALSTLRPPRTDGVLDVRDPRPAMAPYARLARRR